MSNLKILLLLSVFINILSIWFLVFFSWNTSNIFPTIDSNTESEELILSNIDDLSLVGIADGDMPISIDKTDFSSVDVMLDELESANDVIDFYSSISNFPEFLNSQFHNLTHSKKNYIETYYICDNLTKDNLSEDFLKSIDLYLLYLDVLNQKYPYDICIDSGTLSTECSDLDLLPLYFVYYITSSVSEDILLADLKKLENTYDEHNLFVLNFLISKIDWELQSVDDCSTIFEYIYPNRWNIQ